MGVYIHNMEMPTRCLECDWCAHTIPADNYICYRLNRAVIGVAKEDVDESVNVCCPLVPVPPHGRLIEEADAVETAWMILRGLGYLKEENHKLEQTVREVFATAPAIEVEEHG